MRAVVFFALALSCLFSAGPVQAVVFESPHVHPLDISPDGTRLYAVNTDDHRLSIFDLTQGSLPVLVAEIPVGIEPVTARAHGNSEVWVVNGMSGSISIVDLGTLNVKKTLLVGQRPTDVVFAGSPEKAFVSIAQDDAVRIYDATSPGAMEKELLLSGSEPRSLAVGKDGDKVYVTFLDSGNQTTLVPQSVVTNNGGLPPPNPPMRLDLPAAPPTALIVRYNGTFWADEINRNWNFALPYTLLDQDVMEIDVALQQVVRSFTGVGTTLFNLAVNPVSGVLYVTNQEATNEIRFEPNLTGKFVKTRITVIDPGTLSVTPQLLNPHIDYSTPAGSDGERAQSVAFPLGTVVSADGSTVYVAAFGSGKVAVLDASGVVQSRIDVGRGPSGLVLDSAGRLFVLHRLDDTIGVIDAGGSALSGTVRLGFDPVAQDVRDGRTLFYDARNSSAHGDITCGSCHLFGNTDNMAWDLGNPQGDFIPPPQFPLSGFHPMKGPMLTQSMRGLTGTEPLHWRGDRLNLAAFNPAFVSLLGRGAQLNSAELQLFQTFVFSVVYPQNPFRNLDDSFPATLQGGNAAHGEQLFQTGNLVGNEQCTNCHALPRGQNGQIIRKAVINEPQDMEVPQLRNMWEKMGFQRTGASVRGFGYDHDGEIKDLFTHLTRPGNGFTFASNQDRRDVVAFLLAFDTGTPAAVGAQWTMDGTNEAAGTARLNTLLSKADDGTIGLIAKGRDGFEQLRGWSYQGGGSWLSDRQIDGPLPTSYLLGIAGAGHEITFTGVVSGWQTRLGIDRDSDGYRDRDELDAGSDPADPASTPSTLGVADGSPLKDRILGPVFPNPVAAGGTRIAYSVPESGHVRLAIFDITGRQMRVLVDAPAHESGRFEASWDLHDDAGGQVSAGVYFMRITTPTRKGGERIVVLP